MLLFLYENDYRIFNILTFQEWLLFPLMRLVFQGDNEFKLYTLPYFCSHTWYFFFSSGKRTAYFEVMLHDFKILS